MRRDWPDWGLGCPLALALAPCSAAPPSIAPNIYSLTIAIAHLAGSWFGGVGSTFVVGVPKTPKTPVLGVSAPFRFCSCRPFGLKTPASCVMPNSKSGVTK